MPNSQTFCALPGQSRLLNSTFRAPEIALAVLAIRRKLYWIEGALLNFSELVLDLTVWFKLVRVDQLVVIFLGLNLVHD